MRLDPYASHLEEQVRSASAVELVCMLYDALMESVEQARVCLAAGDRAGRAGAISRAQDIIGELSGVLDRTRGGDVARNLASLYGYMIDRLNEANFQQSEKPLLEVKRVAGPLAEAWRELSGAEKAAAGIPVYAGVDSYQAGALSFCA
jgi:flagellar protein FliS